MKMLKGCSLLVLVSLGVLVAIAVLAAEAGGATVTVPDDYPTIQSAIDNADDYDTLFIKDGLYEEAVVVYRPLTIVGESRDGTVISKDDPLPMAIVASKVTLSHVTVQGSTVGAGLILQASYCVIEDVTVRDSLWGLWVNRGFHNVVRNVQCIENDWQGLLVEEADHTLVENVTCYGDNEGIHVRAAVDTTLRGCTSRDNRVHGLIVQSFVGMYETSDVKVQNCVIRNNTNNGMEFSDTDGVRVEGCTVDDSGWSAIRADRCNDVTVRGCVVRNYTRIGIGVQAGDEGCLIEDNTVTDEGTSWSDVVVHGMDDNVIRHNIVRCRSSGISVLWCNDTLVSENVVESTNDNASVNAYGIIVGRHRSGVDLPPTNVTLLRNEVRKFTVGIWVRGGWDIDIVECTVKEARTGIAFTVYNQGDDPIVGGLVKGCTLVGCGMVIEGMIDVTVEGNLIQGAEVGIFFNATTNAIEGNSFIMNVIRDCTVYGLSFNATNGTNTFHTNTFINNTEHSDHPSSADSFNSFLYGNYWDDYEERYPDATIVGLVWDTPYGVGGSDVMDMFPLAYPYDEMPPVADAGADQNVLAGTVVTLDASGSHDNGVLRVYTWTFTYAGTPVDLDGETATFPFLLVGTYEVTLEVEDVWGNSDMSSMMVTVYDDEDPVADAGGDVDAPMGTMFRLSGSSSSDNGIIVRYEWHVDPGGLDRVLEGEAVTLSIAGAGEYPVVLRVWDEAGNTDFDGMTVTVLDTQAPVADAGRDFSVSQGDEVTLIGSWSRDNVGVFSWTWTLTEGGVVVILVGETVTRGFPLAGEYTIHLNATDAAGNWDVDEMVLTVRDTELPVADAGEDLEVDQWTTATFDATGSSDNVGVVQYIWTIAEGSDISRMFGARPEHIFGLSGTFTIELEVWDAAGNVQYDSLLVTVNPVPTVVVWRLGPFRDGDGPLGGVRVETVMSGSAYVGYTGDDGWVAHTVSVVDLVSPVSVTATKDGWRDLTLQVALDDDGGPTGTIPAMKRAAGGGGDDGEDDEDELDDWLPWALVVVLIVAYAGTLLYLSNVAKRAGEG